MRNPPLTAEYIKEKLTVDLEQGVCFWRDPTKMHPRLIGKLAGGPRKNQSGKTYWTIKINGRVYRRSQLILTVATGLWPGEMVDHIDGNSLNDSADNLRHATATENAWNHKKRAKKAQLPMGIRMVPSGKYQARIACNGKQIALGTFATLAEATEAYTAARKEYFHAFH